MPELPPRAYRRATNIEAATAMVDLVFPRRADRRCDLEAACNAG
jgi:hypothetical protein